MLEISQATAYIIWAVMIVLFGVFEAITFQLVSIWFVVGSIAALIASFFGLEFIWQVLIFVIVSALALIITRPLVKKYINVKKLPTNADKVIGQIGVVVEKINNLDSTGQVKADGKIWTARSTDDTIIPNGAKVKIEKIDGVKLIVSI